MKYFITGGAGFLGINLTRCLLERGHSVVSYDFSECYDYPEKDDERVTIAVGDIRDSDKMRREMIGCGIVIHCAAALPSYTPEEIFSIDVDGTKLVLDCAIYNKIERVVMISSTAVYGIEVSNPMLETDKLQAVGPYGEAKIKAEAICLEYRKKGLVVPILRPKTFVGPERLGVWGLLYDWASTGHGFPIIGNGKNRYQLLDVSDLCEAVYLCATLQGDTVNDIFNIGAERYTIMRADYQAVLDRAGYGKQVKTFPVTPMVWALRLLEALRLSPLYKWVYETAYRDSVVSIDKAKRVLGWRPKYSNEDALLRNYAWYLDNAERFKDASGVSHRVPWKQGILSLAKLFF